MLRSPCFSGDDAAELAKQLQNPVAALISVPFQSNFEFNGGPRDDGFRYLVNVQPVVPISIGRDWSIISRTIVPFIHLDDVVTPDSSEGGMGDIATATTSTRPSSSRSSPTPRRPTPRSVCRQR